MEGYGTDGLADSGDSGLDALAACADAVVRGLGPLAVALARLAVEAGGTGTLAGMEALAVERSREIGRGVMQLALDGQAQAEVLLAGVTGADGVRRGRRERGHARPVVTMLGPVRVTRVGYRSGIKGVRSLFPRDAVLNLPPCQYSWQLQKLAEMACRSGSYQLAHELTAAATGVRIGKRQLEEIVRQAASDAQAFAGDRPLRQAVPPVTGPDGRQGLPPLVMSADGKGVQMRPEALRKDTARKAARRHKAFGKRLGTGEKTGHKRIAETGAVFDSVPPDGPPRTPEHVMLRPAGEPARSPQAANRWYTCGITASRAEVIAALFGEADRRDPDRARDWLALADGDVHQIAVFTEQAARRDKKLTILIDFVHVLEYLWKAAWCFHPPGDKAAEDWVSAQGLAILHGNTRQVIAEIGRQAAAHPPRPGGEHDKNIRKTLHYLAAKEPYLDYPAALANGWPIATGIIEGACRHLVADRMGITGARWSLPGAQAILWLRAIHASGDLDAYWNHHIRQEHQRNHLSHYQDSHVLAA